jgi:hypothetical protein
MDLGLRDRSIWLVLGRSPIAWSLAEACLEEGAYVALLGEDGADRPKQRAALTARFGFRFRVAGRADHPSLLRASSAELLLWGGRPAAIVALCADLGPDSDIASDWIAFLSSSAAMLQPGGGLVLIKPDLRLSDEDGRIATVGLAVIEEERRLWQALAPSSARVSAVVVPSVFSHSLTSGAPRPGEEALVNLILFLAGRGFGSVAGVAADGAVQLR